MDVFYIPSVYTRNSSSVGSTFSKPDTVIWVPQRNNDKNPRQEEVWFSDNKQERLTRPYMEHNSDVFTANFKGMCRYQRGWWERFNKEEQ